MSRARASEEYSQEELTSISEMSIEFTQDSYFVGAREHLAFASQFLSWGPWEHPCKCQTVKFCPTHSLCTRCWIVHPFLPSPFPTGPLSFRHPSLLPHSPHSSLPQGSWPSIGSRAAPDWPNGTLIPFVRKWVLSQWGLLWLLGKDFFDFRKSS